MKLHRTASILLNITRLFLLTIFLVCSIQAQSSGVDVTFNAVTETNFSSVVKFILQPDDKIIAYGAFQLVNGVPTSRIARLNPDGTRDTTFNCTTCVVPVDSVVLQPDGKILVTGSLSEYQPLLYRLNADGTRDSTFTSPYAPVPPGIINIVSVRSVTADGKILVVVLRAFSAGYSYTLERLEPSGSIDPAFTPVYVGGSNSPSFHQSPGRVSVLPDGKILVAINSTVNGGGSPANAVVSRYNADGTSDASYESPSASIVGFGFGGASINDFDVGPDQTVAIVGKFISVNGISRQHIARLMPAGNVDLPFNTTGYGEVLGVKILPSGKLLIRTANRFFRLNADGTADGTFTSPSLPTISSWAVDSAGRILSNSGNAFTRLNPDGTLETSFSVMFGARGSITAVAAAPDGKTVIAGTFVRVNGVPRANIALVNPDGSLDTAFDPHSGFNGSVSRLFVDADGKILAVGSFTTYNGSGRVGLARLNTDGSLDTTFNAGLSSSNVSTIAIRPDGKIYIGGGPATIGGQPRTGLALVDANGTLDVSFNPTFGGSAQIQTLLIQPDGKIMVGGIFDGVNGFNRKYLVRLGADGSLDTTFTLAAGVTTPVRQVERVAGGRYLALASASIFRLNSDGSVDTSFTSPVLSTGNYQFVPLADESIIIGGEFSQVNGVARANLVRVSSTGSLDMSFLPGGADGPVRSLARRTDGKVMVGGEFSTIGGVMRFGVARLNVTPFQTRTPFDFDGDGRADIAVFRPSTGDWYELLSQTGSYNVFHWGQAGDRLAPADYDGDGKTDVGVFRDVVPGAGNFAYFYLVTSSGGAVVVTQFGSTGDVPITGDWDGDGKADLAVYRDGAAAGGQSYFYYRPSGSPAVNFNAIPWGGTGDKPLVGDFDGDGRLDAAVFRPSNANWYILNSSTGQFNQYAFGLPTDIPTTADFDGDGKTNIAVFRPSTGFWYTSMNPQTNYGGVGFGLAGDIPAPADYDGDGKADVAVFRPSNGLWYVLRSTQGFTSVNFGTVGDKPIPNAFVP